jgi:uncharacterized protein YjbI with pentapeptide repeats
MKYTQEKIDRMTVLHGKWVQSKGTEGAKLVLIDDNLSGLDLADLDLRMCDLSECNLSECDLSYADFEDARLVACKFNKADCSKADFSSADMEMVEATDASFNDCKMTNCSLKRSNVSESVFDGAAMDGVNLQGAKAVNADFDNTILRDADFENADLSGARFLVSDLTNADFTKTKIRDVNFRRADVSNTGFFDTQGTVARWPANIEDARTLNTSLHPLQDAQLHEAMKYLGFDVDELDYENQTYYYLQNGFLKFVVEEDAIYEALANAMGGQDLWEQFDLFCESVGSSSVSPRVLFEMAKEQCVAIDDMGFKLDGVDPVAAEQLLEAEDLNVAVVDGIVTGHDLYDLIEAEGLLQRAKKELTGTESKVAYGRSRKGVREIKQAKSSMKVSAFKKTFPNAFELIKHQIKSGTLEPESARALIDQFGMTWQIDHTVWESKQQRLSPIKNDVLRLNIDPLVVTDDENVLKTINAIRYTSYESAHPVRSLGAFTIGWVRYSIFKKDDTLLVEEVQSDLPIVRKGLDDESFKEQLKEKGLSDKDILNALDVLQPYVDRFYTDALSLVFDIAHEAGLTVEMLSYEQKEPFGSPKSIYEKLPKSMGMKKVESSWEFIDGKIWRIKPNPSQKRKRRLQVPRKFYWSRR